MTSDRRPGDSDSLRARALELLRMSPADVAAQPQLGIQALFRELQVYQLELEMQNEELRRQQIELEEARDKYASLYDDSPVGYLTLDPRGQITHANLTAATMLGASRSQLLSAKITQFIDRDDQDAFYAHSQASFTNDDQQVSELQMRRADGASLWVRLASLAIHSPASAPSCRVALTDVTALRHAQQTAVRNERLASLGTLAAGLASQINNSLHGIQLATELAQSAVNPAITIDCLAEISEAVAAANAVVDSVQHFAGRDSERRSPGSLSAVLQRALDCVQDQARASGVFIDSQIENVPELPLSDVEIQQVFVNLLANAIDACEPGRRIRVSVSRSEGFAEVWVRDQGRGMSPTEVSRVFDPFYAKSATRIGAGLGLSVVYGIITDHQGSIDVYSQLGRGTQFKVCLPTAS